MTLDVDPIDVWDRYFRHTLHDGNPHFRNDPPTDNRWQRGGVVEAHYLADSENTAWAEWYRHLAEFGIAPMAQMPRDLWEWEIKQVDVADLTTNARLARVNLPLPAPGRASWPVFQEIGETLWQEGWPGLLAPSAARPGGRVLCLFRTAFPLPPPLVYWGPPAPPVGMTT